MPLLGWHCNEVSKQVIFLSISYNYALVYCDYVQVYKEKHDMEAHIIAISTFINI